MVHPSKKIIGEICDELKGKSVVLAVTASAAIYKSIDLARSIMRHGAEVYVVMSKDASKLISPTLFEWATGNKVVTKLSGDIEHVRLAEENDALIISPATVNTINKIAYGIADTPITALALNFIGSKKPTFIVPATHSYMYNTPQTKESIEKLKELGVIIIEPKMVRDVAHYPDIEEITWNVEANILRYQDLKGFSIIVTAGPTREHLDPVRFLSNPSSGTMGVSIANEAYFRGANVSLIHGPLNSRTQIYVSDKLYVESTEEMLNGIISRLSVFPRPTILILAGAPVDYKFSNMRSYKIDSHKEVPDVKLETTPKISKIIRERFKDDVFLVGFSAETVDNDEELIKRSMEKMKYHGFDLIIANNVKRSDIGFASEYNEVYVLTPIGDAIKIPKNYKFVIARRILDIVKEEFKKSKLKR